MSPMPIYTVQATTAPHAPVRDGEAVLEVLESPAVGALGPAVTVDRDGRVSATFQVDSPGGAGSAAAQGSAILSAAAGRLVERVSVWLGEADEAEVAA